jgi:hypothetical protein
MKFMLFTENGEYTLVTKDVFDETLNSDKYYRYSTENDDMLFPFSENISKYRIELQDNQWRWFNKIVFFALVNAQNQRKKVCKKQGLAFIPHFYLCEQGEQDKKWTLLLPTPENRKIAETINKSKKNDENDYFRKNRCYDYEKNRVCRYIHDKDGNRIKNAEGKDITANCSDCPRAGWIGGNRLNCCLCHTCIADCARCPFPKEFDAPFSTKNFDVPDAYNLMKNIEDKLLLDKLLKSLSKDEQAFYTAVYLNECKLADYARELQEGEPYTKLATIQERLYRIRDRIKAKAKETFK